MRMPTTFDAIMLMIQNACCKCFYTNEKAHEGEGEMGTFIYDTREEAIEAWNRRVKDETN